MPLFLFDDLGLKKMAKSNVPIEYKTISTGSEIPEWRTKGL
jgi:hypothetical protein